MGNHAVAVKAIVRSQNQFALMLDLCVKSEPRIVQGTWSGKEALQGPGRFCIDGHHDELLPGVFSDPFQDRRFGKTGSGNGLELEWLEVRRRPGL